MIIHIVDGTFELFRQYYAKRPQHLNDDGVDVGATRAVLRGLIRMIQEGATHLAVCTDHGIESFRNQLFDGYKTGEGIEPEIANQFPILEAGVRALGISLFAMEDYEADDGMASVAAIANADDRVGKVLLYTPDKDLAQCVVMGRVQQVDRRNNRVLDFCDVVGKYGVEPTSIPDWLALCGDTADGIPGLKGWGKKSSAQVLSRYKHVEDIPRSPGKWDITVRGSKKLAEVLSEQFNEAMLYKKLATLVTDAPVCASVDDLLWGGPSPDLESISRLVADETLRARLAEIPA